MPERQFRVTWEIDEWADTPEQAARQAAEVMLRRAMESVFEVTEAMTGKKTTVDLDVCYEELEEK